MSSDDASWIAQCNLWISDSFRLLSIKNGRGFPRTLCDVSCFRFDHVMRQLLLAAGKGHVWFWRIKFKWTDLDENEIFILQWKLVIFVWILANSMNRFKENCHIIQWIDAELIVKEYGIDIFSFLNTVFHNCLEKWLMGFFCSWVYINNKIKPLDLLFVWFVTSHQQSFSYKGTGLPGLNQY